MVFYFLLFSNQLKILDLLFGWLICSATTFSYNTELHNSINDTQSYFSFLLLFLLLWLFKEIKKNIGQGFVENFRVKKKTPLHFLNKYFYSITGLCFIKQQKIFKSWWGRRLKCCFICWRSGCVFNPWVEQYVLALIGNG